MSELMKKRKTLTEPEARYYLIQIINSLQFLHDDYNLVIHRDLKLGNLFIDGDMRIKLGDFGLAAKLVMKDERRKTVCGTPNYIAPEILQGKDGHSFEVDVWSTGVILYTVLVGKPPFESKDVKSTYKRIVANSFAFPEEAGVSTDAKHLIRLMLNVSHLSFCPDAFELLLIFIICCSAGTWKQTQSPDGHQPPVLQGAKRLHA